MAGGLLGDAAADRLCERDLDAVVVHAEGARQLHRLPRIADAMEAAVGISVRAPARHAADIELAVLGIESAAMGAREKLPHERHDCALGLAVDFIAQHEEVAALAVGKVDELALHRSPALTGHVDLA